MAELLLPKQIAWVRFPSPAPNRHITASHNPSKPAYLIGTAGFLLSHTASLATITYQHNVGISVGTQGYQQTAYQQTGCFMSLSDTCLKNSTKYSGASAGSNHRDGGDMYLQVTEAGKYWRLNYRFAGEQKTLTLGAYPAVSLAKARLRRD